jgi:membrane associated rhomboid family serine protease
MRTSYFGRYGSMPPVVKNLLIINILIFLGGYFLYISTGYDLHEHFALYYFRSEKFHIWQYLTYMFMHAYINPARNTIIIQHIFFNMFALWMFGKVLEGVWGGKRFLIYYLITGLGAAAVHTLVMHFQLNQLFNEAHAFINTPSPDLFQAFIDKHLPSASNQVIDFVTSWRDNPSQSTYINEAIETVNQIINREINIPTVGASGAVYGILLAFGMLFPNTPLILLFPPIPIKAKYMVIMYGLLELFLGISQPGSNVAHFAHLGGMLFGFILIKYWNKSRPDFY